MKSFIRAMTGMYRPGFARTLVYMLQTNEYQAKPYLKWFWRTNDFSRVIKRKTLVLTRPAKLLLFAIRIGMLLQVVLGVYLIIQGLNGDIFAGVEFGLATILSYPIVWAHLVVVPLVLGRLFIVTPKERRLVSHSRKHFAKHKATIIAVAGSYGKTTMKEILGTVLSQGKKVAVTPANKNVSVSHARFAARLNGDEEVLIVEYGEGAPGDVKRFNRIIRPGVGIITGIAPAHLDKYKTLEVAAKDIFSLADFLGDKDVYINGESVQAQPFIKDTHTTYSRAGAAEWRVSNVKIDIHSMSFVAQKDARKLQLKSGVIGKHLLGDLIAAVAIADKLGLTDAQIKKGIADTKPYEHRMQPYALHGAWIIDDTYNGNIEGIRAGTELLEELKAPRKIYVTPGLVDQGNESQNIHIQMGGLIAKAKPDKVVLMKHSVTKWIKQGLENAKFSGELVIEDDPLRFYTNLDQFVAAGDLVMLQNDWPDNYR